MRIAWSETLGYAPVDPEVRAITREAARAFADFGCEVEEGDPGWADPASFHRVASMVGAAARFLDRAIEHPDWIEPSMAWQIHAGSRYSAIEYAKARPGQDKEATTLMKRASPRRSNWTTPETFANSVSSEPRPTLRPGLKRVPR